MTREYIESALKDQGAHRINPAMELNTKNVLKTLLRPQPKLRVVKHPSGVEAVGAGYKSGLGGYLGQALDWNLERRLHNPTDAEKAIIDVMHRSPLTRAMTPEAAFARRLRREGAIQQRMTAGAPLSGPEGAARLVQSRAETMHRFHQDMWDMGTPGEILDNTPAQGHTLMGRSWVTDPFDNMIPVRKPPKKMPKVEPQHWQTESAVHRRFQSLLATSESGAPLKEAFQKPEKYNWIPKTVVQRLTPYDPGSGQGLLDYIDRGTRVIRSGRFLHPGYATWLAQNGIIHTTQAGGMVFRNAYKRFTEFNKLPEEDQQMIEGGVGSGLASTADVTGRPYTRASRAAQKLWHRVNDRDIRIMSFIHEAEQAGFHDAQGYHNLLVNPHLQKTRMAIFHQADREPISYTEMSPKERQVLAKMTTSWAWNRGSSTWTARFPLQHPIQARMAVEAGREGQQNVEDYYRRLQGMPPNWLRPFLPIGNKGNLMETGWINPGETLARMVEETPGLVKGSTDSPIGEASPVMGALGEGLMGVNKYATPFKGTQRFTGPLSEMLGRFEPLGVTKLAGKKGGTFKGGLKAAGLRFIGWPGDTLTNPTKTASLGQKDYEKSLLPQDLNDFRLQDHLQRIPTELNQMQKQGITIPPQMIGQYKGDLEAVHALTHAQLQYASQHGAKSFKSLPAINKAEFAVQYATSQHVDPQTIRDFQEGIKQAPSDKILEQMSTGFIGMASHGAGHVVKAWKQALKAGKPPTITPKQ
jgi:hypothetical protein